MVVETETVASTCVYTVLNVKILICSLDFAKITDNASNWLMAERQIEHRKSSSVLSVQLYLTLYECSTIYDFRERGSRNVKQSDPLTTSPLKLTLTCVSLK